MKTFVFLALIASAWGAAYKDALARTKMYPAAVASYNKDPSACIANTFSSGKIQRRISVECDPIAVDSCVAYSAYSTTEKVIVLSFRGTTRDTQLLEEIEESVFKKDVSWIGGGNVSEYFNDGFMKLWNKGIKDDFTTLAAKYPSYDLYITGHSLGGAMAALCASYIQSQNLFPAKQTLLYTFGQPRVGDKPFADKFNKDVPTSYRVVHYHDIAAHIPMRYLEKYHHHEAEVWYYEENMYVGAPYNVCSHEDESIRCSERDVIKDISGSDHHTYFNVTIDSFIAGNCKY